MASFRERKVLGYEIKTLFRYRYYCEIDCFKEETKSIKKFHWSKDTVINLKSITTSKNYKLFINLNEHIRRRNRGAEYAWCFVHSLVCFLKRLNFHKLFLHLLVIGKYRQYDLSMMDRFNCHNCIFTETKTSVLQTRFAFRANKMLSSS